MDSSLFLRGLIIGFSIAAPVGPIGVLCIRRSLVEGARSGFVAGLGAATADAIYGGIAAFGLTVVSNILIGQQVWLRLIGGVFLCYLGVRTFLAAPSGQLAAADERRLFGAYGSTFFLTLTNPLTILSFAAVFAGLGVSSGGGSYASAGLMVLGVFIGSGFWWLILSAGVGRLRTRFAPHHLRWINRASGAVIAAFGLIALLGLKQ